MGSWNELDAVYPPGALTPATAFVVAFGHLAGATSVYAPEGDLAAFVRRYCAGLAPTADLLERAERFLGGVPLDQFAAELRARLTPEQRRCLALNLLDATQGRPAPARPATQELLLEALDLDQQLLRRYREVLLAKNELDVFAQ